MTGSMLNSCSASPNFCGGPFKRLIDLREAIQKMFTCAAVIYHCLCTGQSLWPGSVICKQAREEL